MTPAGRSQWITGICELAAQLRPEERESFVRDQCQGDDQLLQEVQSALTACLLAENQAAGLVPSEATEPALRKTIGRYQITGIIGSGGSGQVYSALDQTVGRVVAIKVLNAPGNADLVRRFQAEAKTVANLHHKNIVTVHEYGEEDGVPYLVMEYLKGTTLQELIRQGSLPLLEKMEIMTEVAEGLHYAHECGITHRDVKPANIMQLTDGAVKIMDFGIARLGAEGTTRLTQTGLLIGSIMYMAPEQFSGTADPLTDVFGFGVTYYELLTGRNPFAAADPVGIIFKIANFDPPPVSRVAPECPEALDRILARTLARDRESRYSSLWDVMADSSGILTEMRRDQAGKHCREAQQLFAAGQWEAARLAVRKVLRLDPGQEDARRLKSEIDETLRKRDAVARADHLMDQAEAAMGQQQFEEAGTILESIRDLAVTHPKIQRRFEWVATQVGRARQRLANLNQAQREMHKPNLSEAFRLVSEVLGEDPSNSTAKDLLQEIRARMAAGEAARHLRDEIDAVNRCLQSGEYDEADARVNGLLARYPDAGSAEHQELQRLRAQVAAAFRQREIAGVVSQAEELMTHQQMDRAVGLLESTIERLGDDWDLCRLLLQARVAQYAMRERAEDEQRRLLAQVEAAESTPAPLDTERWQQETGRAASPLAVSSPLPAAPPKPNAPLSTGQWLSTSERQAPTLVLEGSLPAALQPDREAPRSPTRKPAGPWIAISAAAASVILFILFLLAWPRIGQLMSKLQPTRATLTIDELTGSRTAIRGRDYALDLRASGSAQPIFWSIREGSLPQGLTLGPKTGRISGAPGKSGIFSFLVRAADNSGLKAERAVTLEVVEPRDASAAPRIGDSGSGTAAGTSPKRPACSSPAFNIEQYGDLLNGELLWSGSLRSGDQLEIVNLRATAGSVRGDIFPKGVPLRIFVTPARLRVVTAPAAENCWDPRLVLENIGTAKSEIRIQWEVVQP